MVFVLAAVVDHQIEIGGIEIGIIERALGGPAGHGGDRVVRPGDVNLADAHFLDHDEFRQAGARGDLGAGHDRRGDVRPGSRDADRGEVDGCHKVFPGSDEQKRLSW